VRVADLVGAMEEIAPTRFAAPWDNVGLLVGDAEQALTGALLTIDLTRAVLREAGAAGSEAVVAYHPPLFEAQKRFVMGSLAFEAARAGIAVYSPHTALDAAEGGTNDVLADAMGMTDRAPLRLVEGPDTTLKLVTFVPASHIEALAGALFAAGAGHIGDYVSCSFRSAGTGTFLGGEGTRPVVGEAGRLEEVAEIRLETVVPQRAVPAVIRALRAAHPYEEPAFDLVRLAAASPPRGFGRVGAVMPIRGEAMLERVKKALGVQHVLAAGSFDGEVSRVAVCAGSGTELLGDAIATGAHLFLTGELRHHDALRAVEANMALICTRHSTSERAALVALERQLAHRLPGVRVTRSREDREPLRIA
jgi:dinuclear metal center YbgI/SA1388 family protein